MKIAVAGGTGWIGRLVVETVRAGGDTPVVVSRSTGVDLTTGDGLDKALAGVAAVIDVSNIATLNRKKSVTFFTSATSNLLAAGQRAGVAHHVALSIVGSDRVDLGYYIGKRRQEELVLAGPVPSSVLRATQFHEFASQMIQRAGGAPFVVVPQQLCQPVAAREVAGRLVELARGGAVGLADEMAGPDRHRMPDLVRQLLRARGERCLVVPVRLAGKVGKGMAGGALLPTGPGPFGGIGFDPWLATDDAAAQPGRSEPLEAGSTRV
jgi:uncharacterized protein YbjT (DUF2867 family)